MAYTANVNNYRPERTDIKVYTEDKLGNPHYSSRLYKILSHFYDPMEWSVYVDADIFLTEGMEEKLIEELKASGKLIGVFKNPWRDCIYEEAEEIVRLRKDTKENVELLINEAEIKSYPRHNGLAACGILVRKLGEETNRRNELWWAYVCGTSRRDQLSFPLVWDGVVHYFEGDIYKYKSWKR